MNAAKVVRVVTGGAILGMMLAQSLVACVFLPPSPQPLPPITPTPGIDPDVLAHGRVIMPTGQRLDFETGKADPMPDIAWEDGGGAKRYVTAIGAASMTWLGHVNFEIIGRQGLVTPMPGSKAPLTASAASFYLVQSLRCAPTKDIMPRH